MGTFASQKRAFRGSAIAPASSLASLSPVAASRPSNHCRGLKLRGELKDGAKRGQTLVV